MMLRDIRLHGRIGEQIEYSAMVAGTDAYQRYFFNFVQDEDRLRIFSPGNDFTIGREGISYQGNGGCFCEYMFGVDQPPADLAKPEIINRLVMYGAHADETGAGIRFSDHTGGSENYENIFFEGNAVCNYFFFVSSARLSRTTGSQQEELVRHIGKAVKRSAAVGAERDDLLIEEVFPLLQDRAAQFFLIRLINRHHREYRDLFRQLYFRSKKISDDDYSRLTGLAAGYDIDRYQQERMRIDVMYRHPANKRIVDEYRNILLGCSARNEISPPDNARLTRLKTLSVRSKIPGALFYTLDELLKKGRGMVSETEQDYLAATREVLQGIFLREKEIDSLIDRDDMLVLVRGKKKAMENRDHSFDQLLLDAGKECDEKIRDGAAPSLLDGFSYVITYLDRFDTVANLISQLAFMENVRISEEMLRGLLEHRAAFDNLHEGCFEELFIRDLFCNAYLGRFGRSKVRALLEGLTAIERRQGSIDGLNARLHGIDQEERITIVLLEHVRERIRSFYSKFSTRADQEALRREVTEELKAKRLITGEVPSHLFDEVIVTIKKEVMYLQTLLPLIIAGRETALREDFLLNSGLDRFYVEEVEREYFEKNGLDLELLYRIRTGAA